MRQSLRSPRPPRPHTLLVALTFTLAAALLPRGAAAQRPLKVYISVDMEGIAGVVTGDQLGPTGFEYERTRAFMTKKHWRQLPARDAGATEIVE
jgi:D-amino peptidase